MLIVQGCASKPSTTAAPNPPPPVRSSTRLASSDIRSLLHSPVPAWCAVVATVCVCVRDATTLAIPAAEHPHDSDYVTITPEQQFSTIHCFSGPLCDLVNLQRAGSMRTSRQVRHLVLRLQLEPTGARHGLSRLRCALRIHCAIPFCVQ